jgi:light-regulated signal transduction histidine kinase (bacteriophytochrome)
MTLRADTETTFSSADYAKAVLNILDDAAAEKEHLQDTQRAVVNILEDAAGERGRLEKLQKAVLNILEDASTERLRLEEFQKAVLNILDDLAHEIDGRRQAQDSLHQLNAELDERVRQRTAALEEANAELESFAYSVSHDLRAPLRAVDGFGRKLETGFGGQLGEEGRRQIGVIRDNAQKMGRLIDDLLAFSRMGRREMTLAPVDMHVLAQGIAAEACAGEPGRRVEVTIADLPVAAGDLAMLRQVWFNLLSNAVKFTEPRAVTYIEIGGRREDGELCYWIKDNGVGFDMQYADKLFGVFQRLHGMDEFEGTGVGLALSQRIIHRHGGRIWAEARLDEGATFFFTLPLPLAAAFEPEGIAP